MTSKKNQIQLSEVQARRVIAKYYRNHYDFNVPIPERSEENLEFNKKQKRERNAKKLFNILTAPIGTSFIINRRYSSRGAGSLEITMEENNNISIIGFNDETKDHVEIAEKFINSNNFSWFKRNYPL